MTAGRNRIAEAARAKRRRSILELVESISQWRSGDKRAPHKPLLLLYALARACRGEPRIVPFTEAEPKLRDLLDQFGPPGRSVAAYPFWYLQTDGLWEVPGGEDMPRRSGSKEPLIGALRAGVGGGMPEWIYQELVGDGKLRDQLTAKLLARHFPQSVHPELCAELGLPLPAMASTPRDARFRGEVLRAYQSRCAACGFDVRLRHQPFGVDAAHVMWWQAGGPCEARNGLALCTLHHRALDRGAIGVSEDRRILVSLELSGDDRWLNEMFYCLSGQPLREPQRRSERLAPEFVRWHSAQVFRGPARDI